MILTNLISLGKPKPPFGSKIVATLINLSRFNAYQNPENYLTNISEENFIHLIW